MKFVLSAGLILAGAFTTAFGADDCGKVTIADMNWNSASLIAVVIYAIPPVIRLTNLGIRLVDKDVLEAATA